MSRRASARTGLHASLAHQKGVVFAAAAEDLDDALDLVIAPNQGVYLALFGVLVEVDGVLV